MYPPKILEEQQLILALISFELILASCVWESSSKSAFPGDVFDRYSM